MRDKGVPVDNISNYDTTKEEIVYAAAQETIRLEKVLFVTQKGFVKSVPGTEFDVSKKTVAATKLADEDNILFISEIKDEEFIVLQTAKGMFLRFEIADIPEQKKTSQGVRGIRLADQDFVENAWLLSRGQKAVINIHDKEIDISKLKLSKRDAKGTKRF